MKRNGHDMWRAPGAAMARPVLWSAAGHLMVLLACLLAGAGRGPDGGLLPVVEVHLAGGEPRAGRADSPGPSRPRTSRRVPGLAAPPRGEETPALPEPAALGARNTDSAAGLASPPATIAASGITAGPGAPGPAADAGPDIEGSGPNGAPRGAVVVPGGSGAGPGGTGEAGDRPRSGGEIGVLRERIQSRIVYPGEAVRRGLEGEVLLRIHIETGGIPDEIRVARSSGARLLDDAARRGVVRAAPLPSAPGWVEIPVRFRLR